MERLRQWRANLRRDLEADAAKDQRSAGGPPQGWPSQQEPGQEPELAHPRPEPAHQGPEQAEELLPGAQAPYPKLRLELSGPPTNPVGYLPAFLTTSVQTGSRIFQRFSYCCLPAPFLGVFPTRFSFSS